MTLNKMTVCTQNSILKTKNTALCLILLKLHINRQYDYSWGSPSYLEIILLKLSWCIVIHELKFFSHCNFGFMYKYIGTTLFLMFNLERENVTKKITFYTCGIRFHAFAWCHVSHPHTKPTVNNVVHTWNIQLRIKSSQHPAEKGACWHSAERRQQQPTGLSSDYSNEKIKRVDVNLLDYFTEYLSLMKMQHLQNRFRFYGSF